MNRCFKKTLSLFLLVSMFFTNLPFLPVGSLFADEVSEPVSEPISEPVVEEVVVVAPETPTEILPETEEEEVEEAAPEISSTSTDPIILETEVIEETASTTTATTTEAVTSETEEIVVSVPEEISEVSTTTSATTTEAVEVSTTNTEFKFPQSLSESIVVSYKNKPNDVPLSMYILGANASSTFSATGSTYLYTDAFVDSDLEYVVSENGIKESIILKDRNHPGQFQYRLNGENFDILQISSSTLELYKKGESENPLAKMYTLSAPKMFDSLGNESTNLSFVVEGDILTLIPDADWIASAVYPIVVDPTIEINVLNVHSHPVEGEFWDVDFTTVGKANLTITPADQATIDDMQFTSLFCDEEEFTPEVLEGDVIFYPDWECNGIGRVRHLDLLTGNHHLILQFANESETVESEAFNATIVWDGGGLDANWNTGDNWSGNVAPGTGDLAVFDGTCVSNCSPTINVSIDVLGISITSGYAGVVTQSSGVTVALRSSGYTQAGGTFSGNAGPMTLSDGSFSLTGGVFTAPSATTTIQRNFTASAGTFNANGGTFDFTDDNSLDNSTLSCAVATFNKVVITKDSSGSLTVGSNCTLPFGASPTSAWGGVGTYTNNGTITIASGTWNAGGNTGGSGPGDITNNGTITHNGNGWIMDGGLVMGSSGVVTYSGSSITVGKNFNVSQGTFPNGQTVTFTDVNGNYDSTLTCGSVTFTQVIITKNSDGDMTIASGCTVPLGASPTTNFSATTINNGTITVASGTWSQSGGGSGPTTLTNNGTITHNGNGWVIDGGLVMGSSAVVTYAGSTMSLGRDLNVSVGTFPSGLTVSFVDSNGNYDSTLTCGSVTFTQVNITKDSTGDMTIASGCTVPLGASPNSAFSATAVNNGTITIASGTWTITDSASGVVDITNNGTITHNGDGWVSSNGLIMGSSGVVTYAGTNASFSKNLNLSQGTFPSGKNITLLGPNGNYAATLTCGSVTFSGLTINKSTTLAFGSSCTVTGDVTITAATVSNPASAYNLIIQGNFTHTAGTLGGANLTLSFEGSGTSLISKVGGTYSSLFKVNKSSSGDAKLTSTFVTSGQTCTVTAGIFNINGQSFTCGSTFTVNSGATLKLIGSETTLTTPTLNSGSTVTYVGDADGSVDTYQIKNWTYSNLEINTTDAADVITSGSTIATNLQSYWNFDEATASASVVDSAGSNTGTAQGAAGSNNLPQPSTDMPTTSFTNLKSKSFDGTDDYIYTSTSYTSPQQYSISFWFKTSTASGKKFFGFENAQSGTGGSSYDRHVYMGTDGKVRFGWYSGSGQIITSGSTLNNGAWHHVVAKHNGTTGQLFIDGVSQGTNTSTALDYSGYWRMGSYKITAWTSALDGYVTGLMDDVRLYSRALTDAEVTTLSSGSDSNAISTISVANLNLTSGTFIPPATLNVSGNFTNTGGTFTHNSGSVVLNGTDQTVTGNNTFNNFTKNITTPARTLTLGGTQTFVGTMDLQGTSGNLLSLRSTTTGVQTRIDPQGTRTVSYLDVKDNYNINATSIDIDANNITDSGNNTGWGFAAPPVAEEETPSTGGSSGSSSGNNSGGGGGSANSVLINLGAATTSAVVSLSFNAPLNTQRVVVSNTPDFSSFATFQYANRLDSWNLCDKNVCQSGYYGVYVKFYDIRNLPSEVYFDVIYLDKKSKPETPPGKKPDEELGTSLSASIDNRTFTGSLSGIQVNQKVYLRSAVEGVKNGKKTTYKFDCTSDGSYEVTISNSSKNIVTTGPVCSYSESGTYFARVEVGSNGEVAYDSLVIKVAVPPQTVPILPPIDPVVTEPIPELPITVVPEVPVPVVSPAEPEGSSVVQEISEVVNQIVESVREETTRAVLVLGNVAPVVREVVVNTSAVVIETVAENEMLTRLNAISIAPILLATQYSIGGGNILFKFKTLSDVYYALIGLMHGLLTSLGFRRRRRYWGVVYDSVTKQPIDPAIVELVDIKTGKVVEQSITDIAGRYGFLHRPGTFMITAGKTHYEFPSKLVTGKEDGIFSNVYHGESFVLTGLESVMVPNIPMDPLAVDWNQEEKERLGLGKIHFRLETFVFIALKFLFWGGFVVMLVTAFNNPSPANLTFASVYAVLCILNRFVPDPRLWGKVRSNTVPVGGLIVEVRYESLPDVVVAKVVTNANGNFFLKAPSGDYVMRVKKIGDQTNIVLVIENVTIGKSGVLNKDITIPD